MRKTWKINLEASPDVNEQILKFDYNKLTFFCMEATPRPLTILLTFENIY